MNTKKEKRLSFALNMSLLVFVRLLRPLPARKGSALLHFRFCWYELRAGGGFSKYFHWDFPLKQITVMSSFVTIYISLKQEMRMDYITLSLFVLAALGGME